MLNKRQLELYNYLLEHEGEIITKSQIVDQLINYYSQEEKKKNSKSHKILDDIKEINDSTMCEKIIIYKNNFIKVASEEEAGEYMKSFYKKGLISFKHYGALKRKIATNGQGQLSFEDKELLSFIERFTNYKEE